MVGVSFSAKLSIKKACLWWPDGFCAGKKKPERTVGQSAGFTPGLVTRRVCKRIAWPLAGGIVFPKHASLQIISRGISLRCSPQMENVWCCFDRPACVFSLGSLLSVGGCMCLEGLAA